MPCSSPAIVASISAALRACTPCPAAPPARRWMLADRVPLARAAPGQQIVVDFSSIPVRDSIGRVAHVRGIMFDAIGTFTCAAQSDAVSAYQLRSLISEIMLQDVTGHYYMPNLEGRVLIDDTWYRHWSDQQWRYLAAGAQVGNAFGPAQTANYGLAANLNAQVTRQLSIYFPLVTENPEYNPLMGLIPIAALQTAGKYQGAMKFRLGLALKGAAAGITFNGVTNVEGTAGMDIWLDIVYLPVIASTPWTLDSYTQPWLTGILPHADAATEHAWIRFLPEDAALNAGQALVANLNQFQLSIAGYNELAGPMSTLASFARRMDLYYAAEPMGALARANAKQDLPIRTTPGTDATLQTLCIVPYRQVGSGESSGPVIFGVQVNPNVQQTRYVQRVVDCVTADWHGTLVEASSCSPCGPSRCVGLNPTGKAPSKRGVMVTPVQGVG